MSFGSPLFWQVRFLASSLTKKNYKATIAEINTLVKQYGEDTRYFLIACLLQEIDFRDVRGAHNSTQKVQFLAQELVHLAVHTDFPTIITKAFDAARGTPDARGKPAFAHAITADLLSTMFRILRFTQQQAVLVALGMARSRDRALASEAATLLATRVPALGDTAAALPPSTQGLLAHFARTNPLFDAPEHRDARAACLRALSAAAEHSGNVDLSLEALADTTQGVADQRGAGGHVPPGVLADAQQGLDEGVTLAAVLGDFGPTATQTPEAFADVLVASGYLAATTAAGRDVPPRAPLLESDIGACVALMCATPGGTDDGTEAALFSSFSNVLGSGRGAAANEARPPSPTLQHEAAWNMDVFAAALRMHRPGLNWAAVVASLDTPEACFSSPVSLDRLMVAHRAFAHDEQFPFAALVRPWANARAQLDLLRQCTEAAPALLDFQHCASFVRIEGTVDQVRRASPSGALACTDVVDALLRLATVPGLLDPAKALLDRACAHCPEVLAVVLASCSSHWHGLREQMLRDLVPPILRMERARPDRSRGGSPTEREAADRQRATRIVQTLWKVNPSLILLGAVRMFGQAEDGLRRILPAMTAIPNGLTVLSKQFSHPEVAVAAFMHRFVQDWHAMDVKQWVLEGISAGDSGMVLNFCEVLLASVSRALSDQLLDTSEDEAARTNLLRGATDALCGASLPSLLHSRALALRRKAKERFSPSAPPSAPSSATVSPSLSSAASQSGNTDVTRSPIVVGGRGTLPPPLRDGGLGPSASAHHGSDVEAMSLAVKQEANRNFIAMYQHEVSVPEVVDMLKAFRNGTLHEQQVFTCMIFTFMNEYKHFGDQSAEDLRVTGELFGSIIRDSLLTKVTLGPALRHVIDALTNEKLYPFGIVALQQIKPRLPGWVTFVKHIVQFDLLRKRNPEVARELEELIRQMESGQGPVAEQAHTASHASPSRPSDLAAASIASATAVAASGSSSSRIAGRPPTHGAGEPQMPTTSLQQRGRTQSVPTASSTGGPRPASRPDYHPQARVSQASPLGTPDSPLMSAAGNAGDGPSLPPPSDMLPPNPMLARARSAHDTVEQSRIRQHQRQQEESDLQAGAPSPVTMIQSKSAEQVRHHHPMASVHHPGGPGSGHGFGGPRFGIGNGPGSAEHAEHDGRPALNPHARPHIPQRGRAVDKGAGAPITAAFGKGLAMRPFECSPPSEKDKLSIQRHMNNLSMQTLPSAVHEIGKLLDGDLQKAWLANKVVDMMKNSEERRAQLLVNFLHDFGGAALVDKSVHACLVQVREMLEGASLAKDRQSFRHLGCWLGRTTLVRNRPLLYRDLDLKELLASAYEHGLLMAVVPFVDNVLTSVSESKVFKAPNPWTLGVLSVLLEIQKVPDIKGPIRFSISNVQSKILAETGITVRPSSLLQRRYCPDHGCEDYGKKQGKADAVKPGMPRPVPVGRRGKAPTQALTVPGGVIMERYPNVKAVLRKAFEETIEYIKAHLVPLTVERACHTASALVLKDFAGDQDAALLKKTAMATAEALAMQLLNSQVMKDVHGQMIQAMLNRAPEVIAIEDRDQADTYFEQCWIVNKDYLFRIMEIGVKKLVSNGIVERIQESLARRSGAARAGPGFTDGENMPPQRVLEAMPPSLRPEGPLPGPVKAVYDSIVGISFNHILGELRKVIHSAAPLQAKIQEIVSIGQRGALESPQLLGSIKSATAEACSGHAQQAEQLAGDACNELLRTNKPSVALLFAVVLGGMEDVVPSLADRVLSALAARILSNPIPISAIALVRSGVIPLPKLDAHLAILVTKSAEDVRANPALHMKVQVMTSYAATVLQALVRDHSVPIDAMHQTVQSLLAVSGMRPPIDGCPPLGHVQSLLNTLQSIKLRRLDPLVLVPPRSGVQRPVGHAPHPPVHAGPPGGRPMEAVPPPAAPGSAIPMDPPVGVGWTQPGVNAVVGVRMSHGMRAPIHHMRTMDKFETACKLMDSWVEVVRQSRGMDSPDRNESSETRFLHQLHHSTLLSSGPSSAAFFWVTGSLAVNRALESIPEGASVSESTPDYTYVDAFISLFAVVLRYMDPKLPGARPRLRKCVLEALVDIAHKDCAQRVAANELWDQRPHLRLLQGALREACEHGQYQDVVASLRALRPSVFPRFTLSWLELFGHRSILPRLLSFEGGRVEAADLLCDLLVVLGAALRRTPLTPTARALQVGTMRLLMMIWEDFQVFLVAFHFPLVNALPERCTQLRNLVLCASPPDVPMEELGGDVKVDSIPAIRDPPVTGVDHTVYLHAAGLLDGLEDWLKSQTGGSAFLDSLPEAFAAPPAQLESLAESGAPEDDPALAVDTTLVHAFVLHVGVCATSGMIEGSKTTATLFCGLMDRLDPLGRRAVISSMANQLRYTNSHTYFFSCALLVLFQEASPETRTKEIITRVLVERMYASPRSWGATLTLSELLLNKTYQFWSLPFVTAVPDFAALLHHTLTALPSINEEALRLAAIAVRQAEQGRGSNGSS